LNNLSIPCPDTTREERVRDAHQNRALRLVRQDDWGKLITLITTADRDRSLTPGGMCVAELMAFGARADVVLAIEHALLDRVPEKDAPMMRGIEALEYVLEDYPSNYVIGCIVAQAHIDIAWSWRGIGWDVEIAPRNREAFEAHFARARDIIASFEGVPAESALLASTACALLRGENYSTEAVADRYESLIDLNSKNIAPFRALGTHMLPLWYGSYAALELEARCTAIRSQSEWGAAATLGSCLTRSAWTTKPAHGLISNSSSKGCATLSNADPTPIPSTCWPRIAPTRWVKPTLATMPPIIHALKLRPALTGSYVNT
jgi:hypothetical protein